MVTPRSALVTNVGWDHMQFLGDVGVHRREKAGIIKTGVPVVVGGG